MYFLLILFFSSSLGICIIISRKLILVREGKILQRREHFLKNLSLNEWKYESSRLIKKYGYNGLVFVLRLYVQSSLFTKEKYAELKSKIKEIRGKKENNESTEVKGENGFLKMISEYKHKVRQIKNRIEREEEENL